MEGLRGKVGIVTGAARGIGAATATALAQSGVHLVLNDVLDNDDLATVAQQCRDVGVKVELVVGDSGSLDNVQSLVDTAVERMGSIDLAVANAAFSRRELFYEAELGDFERTIQVTMWGPFYLTRCVAQAMIETETRGAIVVIGSPHANRAVPGSMAYNMAKAAVDQMARTAALELAAHRIRVNIVHPGWVDTPGERRFFSEEKIAELGAALPLGRLAKPEEIARGVVFLSDPENEYITGSTLCIDGGIVLPYREMHRVEDHP